MWPRWCSSRAPLEHVGPAIGGTRGWECIAREMQLAACGFVNQRQRSVRKHVHDSCSRKTCTKLCCKEDSSLECCRRNCKATVCRVTPYTRPCILATRRIDTRFDVPPHKSVELSNVRASPTSAWPHELRITASGRRMQAATKTTSQHAEKFHRKQRLFRCDYYRLCTSAAFAYLADAGIGHPKLKQLAPAVVQSVRFW